MRICYLLRWRQLSSIPSRIVCVCKLYLSFFVVSILTSFPSDCEQIEKKLLSLHCSLICRSHSKRQENGKFPDHYEVASTFERTCQILSNDGIPPLFDCAQTFFATKKLYEMNSVHRNYDGVEMSSFD